MNRQLSVKENCDDRIQASETPNEVEYFVGAEILLNPDVLSDVIVTTQHDEGSAPRVLM